MTRVESLHQKAMAAADLADRERHVANPQAAKHFFEEALDLEQQAARLVSLGDEPTRSVLFRSAASLALECGDYDAVARLVREARLGSPPPEIVAELVEIEHVLQIARREAS